MAVIVERFDSTPIMIEIVDAPDELLLELVRSGSEEAAAELLRRQGGSRSWDESLVEARHPGHPNQKVHAGGRGPKVKGLIGEVKKNEGATIKLSSMSSATTGIVVARRRTDEVRPGVPNGIVMDQHTFFGPHGPKKLAQYVRDRAEVFDEPGVHLGLWWDKKNREVAIDISEVVTDRARAVALGRRQNQQSIFDLDTFEEIDTGGTGDRAWEDSDGERRDGRGAPARPAPEAGVADERRGAGDLGRRADRRDGTGLAPGEVVHYELGAVDPTTLLELVGLALIVAGVSLVSVPAGLIVAGVGLILLGFLLSAPAPTTTNDDEDGER